MIHDFFTFAVRIKVDQHLRHLADIANMWNYVAALLIVVSILWTFTSRRPIGPVGIPFVGVALFIGRRPEIKFKKWADHYGKLFSMHCFGTKLVVVNSFEMLNELFVNRGNQTSGRPKNFLCESVGQNSGLSMRSRDANWLEQKRFTLTSLRKFGFTKLSTEVAINEEISHLIEHMKSTNGEYYSCAINLVEAINNVICLVTIGRRFHYDDEKRLSKFVSNLTDIIREEAFGVQMMLYVPILRHLPYFKKSIKALDDGYGKLYDLIDGFIEEHKESLQPSNSRDFIDDYLVESQKEQSDFESQHKFTERMLRGLVRDFFVAGTETTTTTLLWSFLILSNRPKLQDNLFKEIDSVIGCKVPDMRCKQDLHLVQAFMVEVLRYRPLVPLALPHAASCVIHVKGHSIKEGELIIPNLYAIHHDESIWDNPDVFDPYRHLTDENAFVKFPCIIPFGIGPRTCPGKLMATMQYFKFLVSILQHFKIQAYEPDYEFKNECVEQSGLVLAPPNKPFYKFVPR